MMDESRPGSGGRSRLGTGSRITGELYFPSTLELPGYVSGRVEAAAIVIEEAGDVEGELSATNIAISRTVVLMVQGAIAANAIHNGTLLTCISAGTRPGLHL